VLFQNSLQEIKGGFMKIIILALLVCTMVSGCATVPMASLDSDQQAKQFKKVVDKSSIYIFRNESFGAAIKIPITINGIMIGQTAPDTFFNIKTDPGPQTITCLGETTESLLLTTKPERIYYIRQEMKMGLISARCAIYEVIESEGKEAVNSCNLAQSSFL
jgi:uncharacterized protein YceK